MCGSSFFFFFFIILSYIFLYVYTIYKFDFAANNFRCTSSRARTCVCVHCTRSVFDHIHTHRAYVYNIIIFAVRSCKAVMWVRGTFHVYFSPRDIIYIRIIYIYIYIYRPENKMSSNDVLYISTCACIVNVKCHFYASKNFYTYVELCGGSTAC